MKKDKEKPKREPYELGGKRQREGMWMSVFKSVLYYVCVLYYSVSDS